MAEVSNGRPSYQWTTNLLVAALGAIVLTAVGWMKTYLDTLDTKVEDISSKIAVIQSAGLTVVELNTQIRRMQDDISLLNYKMEQLIKTNEGLVLKVAEQQRTLDIQADWISAHAHADKAVRELRGH